MADRSGDAPSKALADLPYLVLLAVFLALKLSFPGFYPAAEYRDTASYAQVAEKPLTSLQFWAGERPFTLPLLFKLAGMNSQNFTAPPAKTLVAGLQAWISILCWTVLGLVVARRMRRRWLGWAAFGLVLAFSLVYDVSKWDRLMLSESLSISLLALLLAGWIGLLELRGRSLRGYLVTGAVVLTSIFYSFTRDANPYFVLIGATVFAAAAFFRRFRLSHAYTLIYLGSAILLVLAQNASINTGSRWQVFIYDHLAYRIIPNPAALQYFTDAGLPVSDQLLQIPGMRGYVYQALLMNDPSMEPVRQWVNTLGKQTYAGYLLSHLRATLRQPLGAAAQLLDGTLAYGDPNHNQLFPNFPAALQALTNFLFPILPLPYYAAAYAAMLGLTGWALLRGWRSTAWWVAAVMLASMYPLMFLSWHGDPMEIERHALQVAIQFRLVFWLVLILGLDQAAASRRAILSRGS